MPHDRKPDINAREAISRYVTARHVVTDLPQIPRLAEPDDEPIAWPGYRKAPDQTDGIDSYGALAQFREGSAVGHRPCAFVLERRVRTDSYDHDIQI